MAIHIRRRQFIFTLGGAAVAWPFAARAQQSERVRRIGVVIPLNASDPDAQPRMMTFQRALRELGWTEGRNIQIDYRWTGADADRIVAHATEAAAAART